MNSIRYINRQTGQIETEEVFGESAIRFLYGNSFLSTLVLHGFAKWPFVSSIYGFLQKIPSSKRKIIPFIKRFGINTSEFLESVESYQSFNDFFIRKLKPTSRALCPHAIIPADGRYTFYPELSAQDEFDVKGKSFNIHSILKDPELAKRYAGGSLCIARLCPIDCHRFYFPIDCIPNKARLINGKLYSVNPIATKDNPWIWGANRRMLTLLDSKEYGQVAFLEIGATNVGSIIQTYEPNTAQLKGNEKGYFSFGGSALLIFFEKGRIQFDADLLAASRQGLEIRCLIGQSLGAPSTEK